MFTRTGDKINEPVKQKIRPNLWFDRQAEEAANFYVSLFKNSKTGLITRASRAGFENHHLPEGTVMTVEFELAGQQFIGINGGPIFQFNPTISFLVTCLDREEVDFIWSELSRARGPVFMELGAYPFSERYGWIQDKYGLSWQVMLTKDNEIKQKIIPTLMYTGNQKGRAEEAVNLYTRIFNDSAIDHIMRYTGEEQPDKEGTVKHAGFRIEGMDFAAMDSARVQGLNFNEAISLMIVCENQKEIDYYWDKLTGDGGQESVCGWLKDKFGISWQVAPSILSEMLKDPDKKKVERVTEAFMKMKKFEIEGLKRAYRGD